MGRRFKAGEHFRVELKNPGFVAMRKDSKLVSIFRVRGETWVSRLNTELHAAQKARKQPVADGYTFYIHTEGSRARLYIVAFTARAQAHERKHSSILKLMETSRYEVKTRGQLERVAARKAGARTRKRERELRGGLTKQEFELSQRENREES
jgi:hypothetical protein